MALYKKTINEKKEVIEGKTNTTITVNVRVLWMLVYAKEYVLENNY